MFGKIKNWLGIEGVKVEINVPRQLDSDASKISGNLLFYSQTQQRIQQVQIRLVEKYARGRKKNRLIDQYILGEMTYDHPIEIPAEQFIELEFDLPFSILKSAMDEYADYNFITKGLVQIAKYIKNAQSEYFIEARISVKGRAMDVQQSLPIQFS